eukprot:gene16078-17701_t
MEGGAIVEPVQCEKSVTLIENEREGQLVKSDSQQQIIRHPLSSQCALHGDYLPKDLLENLTNHFENVEDLRPQGNGKLKRSKAFPKVYPKRPPDNLWNHARTREKFKHLTEQPPCTCGAGRDISFLCDSNQDKKSSPNSPAKELRGKAKTVVMSQDSTRAPSKEIIQTVGETDKEIKPIAKDGSLVPDTLIPSEFHIVKNPGVIGMEIHDGKYTTVADNHEKHLTLFPSLKPSGRQEAKLLKKTMEDLLSRIAVTEDTGKDADQPTQIHSLLELVRQEQNIYNIVFNEVIRQVSIECVERGELLAELRKRYAKLLDKIPRQVKSLHEEVLAQRALDRRLTEELTRFKSSISLLTRELQQVQEHDREVTQQAVQTQNELDTALKESEKNANLLAEYHELYELQRKRLEFQITKLIEERDLWAGASYTLSLKVARRHNLKTAKRLHLHEKAWYKLSCHFASLLSDIDSTQLQELTQLIQGWQDVAENFDNALLRSEMEACRKLQHIKKQINYWGNQFLRVVTPDEGSVHPPDSQVVRKLNEDMKQWEEVFNTEIERFSGDVLLSYEDGLIKMSHMIDHWSDIANKIYRRHPTINGSEKPERELMLRMNHEVEKLHNQFRLRMTGENGLAKGLIHSSIGNKLNAFSNGGEIILDPEWVHLADYLQNEWPEILSELIDLVTPPPPISTDEQDTVLTDASYAETIQRNDLPCDVKTLSKLMHKWQTETLNSIENSDAGILEHVSSSHSNMVRWMVTVLLRLAPNTEEDEFKETSDDDNTDDTFNTGIGATIVSESTLAEIKHRAKIQFTKLTSLTDSLYNCCNGIVSKDQNANGDDMAELEAKDLKKMKTECQDWIKTAVILIKEISGEKISEEELSDLQSDDKEDARKSQKQADGDESKESSSLSDGQLSTASKEGSSAEQEAEITEKDQENIEPTKVADTNESKDSSVAQLEGTEKEHGAEEESQLKDKGNNTDKIAMHVIGSDDNVRVRSLDEFHLEQETPDESHDAGIALEKKTSMEVLDTIMKLQSQLVETEERAQIMEERAITAETQLKEALERIRALERSFRRTSQSSPAQSGKSSPAESTTSKGMLNENTADAEADNNDKESDQRSPISSSPTPRPITSP